MNSEEAETAKRIISQALIPQLIDLVSSDSDCTLFLKSILNSTDKHLDWYDLDRVESGIHHSVLFFDERE